jgi:hypothetical protein
MTKEEEDQDDREEIEGQWEWVQRFQGRVGKRVCSGSQENAVRNRMRSPQRPQCLFPRAQAGAHSHDLPLVLVRCQAKAFKACLLLATFLDQNDSTLYRLSRVFSQISPEKSTFIKLSHLFRSATMISLAVVHLHYDVHRMRKKNYPDRFCRRTIIVAPNPSYATMTLVKNAR